MTEEGWPLQDVGEVGNGCGPWVGAVGIRWSRVLASGSSVEGVKMLYDLNRESGHIYLLIKDISIYIYIYIDNPSKLEIEFQCRRIFNHVVSSTSFEKGS